MKLEYPKDGAFLSRGCVAMIGKGKNTSYDASGKGTTTEGEQVLYFPISGIDDMDIIDNYRRRKGYAVIGYDGLERILRDGAAEYKKGEIGKLKQQLDLLVNSPEMKMVREAQAKLADAEAKIAVVEAPQGEKPEMLRAKR